MSSLDQISQVLFRDARTVITVGAGGVGKTTCSIAIALLGAYQGKRVGLLSIDPAKRLAQAMGLGFSSKLTEVTLPSSFKGRGSLHAVMLDQKVVFDEMVLRFSPSETVARKILDNKLYQVVSKNLGGPLEYMALAKLEKMVSGGEFDLVVLDTPPDTHAIDFMMRPNILSGFMENKVMTWLIKPFYLAQRFGVQKIFQAGERMMGGVATVLGIKALNVVAEFLVLMEDVISGFHRSGQAVVKIMRDPSTRFMLVTMPTPAAMRSTKHLAQQLSEQGFALDTLVVNQMLPASVTASLKTKLGSSSLQSSALGMAIEQLRSRDAFATTLIAALKHDIAVGNHQSFATVTIQEQDCMIHTVEALAAMLATWQIDTRKG